MISADVKADVRQGLKFFFFLGNRQNVRYNKSTVRQLTITVGQNV